MSSTQSLEQVPSKIHSSWIPHLSPMFQSEDMKYLKYKILPTEPFFPASEDIFNVFEMPLDQIKVVILGQDPYPNKGDAIGYAFAVPWDRKLPASLRTIFQEIERDSRNQSMVGHDLKGWRKQGVFLLNTALTVQAGKPGSHRIYWNRFIDKVINVIAREAHPVWMLWGKEAQNKERMIREYDSPMLKAPHPAAESYRPNAGFIGCRHFSRCNEILEERGKEPIDWHCQNPELQD